MMSDPSLERLIERVRLLDQAAAAADRSGDASLMARIRRERTWTRAQLVQALFSAEHWEECAGVASISAQELDATGDEEYHTRVEGMRALALVNSGHPEEALPVLREVIAGARKLGNIEMQAGVEHQMLLVLDELQRADEVRACAERIIALAPRLGGIPFAEELIDTHWRLSRLLVQSDRAAEAVEHTRAAADLAAIVQHERLASIQFTLATLLLSVERPEEAEVEYLRFLRTTDPHADRSLMEHAIAGLARAVRGRPEEGEAHFGRLAAGFARAGEVRLQALCHFARAECMEHIRRREWTVRAAEFVKAARLFDGEGSMAEAGEAYRRAGTALKNQCLLDRAYREEASRFSLLAAERLAAAGNWLGKGIAEEDAAGALSIRDINNLDEPHDPRVVMLLARSARSFRRARAPRELATVLITLANFLYEAGKHIGALRAAIAAFRAYDRARVELPPQEREYLDNTVNQGAVLLRRHVFALYRQNPSSALAEAAIWQLEQGTKARSFQDERMDLAATRALLDASPDLRSATLEVDRLQQVVDEHREGMEQALAMGDDMTLDRHGRAHRTAEEMLWAAQKRRSRVAAQAERDHPQISLAPTIPAVTAGELAAVFRPGEAYIGFLLLGDDLARLVVRSEGCSISVPEVPRELDLGMWLERLSPSAAGMPRKNLAIERAREIASALLGEIPDQVNTLIISPDGPLLGLPWHRLPIPGARGRVVLGDRYAIAVVPAAGTLRQIRVEPPSTHTRAYLGVACNGDGTIPLVDREVESVAHAYFDEGASVLPTPICRQLFEGEHDVELLHLACHAGPGGLLLSETGSWTVPAELLGLGVRARILLLTGCNAGRFRTPVLHRNELLGVVRQLLVTTGARAAVVSMEPVLDTAGVLFSDLLICALTGRRADRPWSPPPSPLPVASAVEWARGRLRGLSPEEAAPLVDGRYMDPSMPAWWAPWYVVGDPAVRLG